MIEEHRPTALLVAPHAVEARVANDLLYDYLQNLLYSKYCMRQKKGLVRYCIRFVARIEMEMDVAFERGS